MSTINHNAVIATTYSPERFEGLTDWIRLFPEDARARFAVGPVGLNGYRTIALVPDGSKEGWPDSDAGDGLRQSFIDRLELDAFGDGSSPWDWVEVGFGEYGQKLLRGNCRNGISNAEYHEAKI